MKHWLTVGVLLAAALGAQAEVVQPAYEGKLGNPEEPALRPYKWALSGIGALFYQTGKHFRDGNMGTPVLGTVNTLRGAGVGSIELGESVYNGLVYRPLVDHKEFKKLHRANRAIDNDLLARNVRDGLSTGLWYPLLKFNDHYPMEDEEKVQARIAAARAKREAQQAAQEARRTDKHLSAVERAQVSRNPERAARGAGKKKDLEGNLLKLGSRRIVPPSKATVEVRATPGDARFIDGFNASATPYERPSLEAVPQTNPQP